MYCCFSTHKNNSFCAKMAGKYQKGKYPFIFNRFLLRAPQPSEAPPLLARIASNGHREICG